MTLVSIDPLESLLRLQRELERSLGSPVLQLEGGGMEFPPINAFSDKNGLVIRVEVPGFKADQVEVSLESHTLTLRGRRPSDEHPKPGGYHRRERQYGSFARSIQLPKDLDAAQAVADCRNGLLTIRIPKAAAAKPRQIEIKAA